MENLNKNTFDSIISSDTVIVVFSAIWCGPCKTLKPTLNELEKEGYKIYMVDADDEIELCKKYSIKGVPSILVFKDGVLYNRGVGALAKNKILELLSK